MEKLIYLLWKPQTAVNTPVWQQELLQLPTTLRSVGAQKLRVNLPDDEVIDAASMCMTDQPPLPDALLSFWISSSFNRAAIEEILQLYAARIAGYSVCESEPLPNTLHPVADGIRCYGLNHVVFLRKPERLTREEWLSTWLDSHTQIAIDTQQTFGYRQNIVVRTLTPDAPLCDAIVEENFPPEAISDQNAFYRQDTAEALLANQKAMFQSCVRFIDFDKMGRLPTSEYNFN